MLDLAVRLVVNGVMLLLIFVVAPGAIIGLMSERHRRRRIRTGDPGNRISARKEWFME